MDDSNTPQANQDNPIEEIRSSFRDQLSDSISTIENLGRTIDAATLFVAVFSNMCFGPAEHMTEGTYGTVPVKVELLSYYLYPFFGVSDNRKITPFHVNACLEALDKLHVAYMWTEGFMTEPKKPDSPIDGIVEKVRARAMTIRGSAYPEQTREEIISIQGKFEDWFVSRLGIGPTRACDILYAITESQEEKYNNFVGVFKENAKRYDAQWKEAKKKWMRKKSEEKPEILQILGKRKTAWLFGYFERLNQLAPDILPVARTELNMDLPPSLEEWQGLKGLIGLTKAGREQMINPLGVREKNLFFLPDNKVLLADISHSLDLIWDSFERVARGNQEFYDKRYQRQKAQWLEDRVADHLLKLFPSDRVFRRLDYPNPERSDASTAELDLAVDWGPFLILIEAKARQFRMESQLGDAGRLRTDIRSNIEDAFQQARRAANYITVSTAPEFIERDTGRSLVIRKNGIRRIYMITVSQHHLSGLATELASLKDLGLFKDGEYPLAISECDLDIVTELCDGPDIFLHYIERRLEIQKESIEIIADELDFFGAYLDCRLQASRIWARDGDSFNLVCLSGYTDKFDRWIMYKRHEIDTPPAIGLSVPNEILQVLKELRARDDDGARWIAFALLDMSDNKLGGIAKAFRELREAELTPGMFRRLVHKDGDTVISFTASLDLPPTMLRERNAVRVQVEKYKHKAFKSIGFGIMVLDKKRLFDCAAYAEGPWNYDEKFEKVIEAEPPCVLAPGQKLPSIKATCPCGSGKKFKDCCLSKYPI